MVAILVFLTFMVAIFIEVMAHRKTHRREVPIGVVNREKVSLSPVIAIPKRETTIQFPNDFYYHNGHAWVKLEGRDRAILGLDDLTQKVMGIINEIGLPPLGKELFANSLTSNSLISTAKPLSQSLIHQVSRPQA